MAFRAMKAAEYDAIRQHLSNFRGVLVNKISQMAAGSVTAGLIRSLLSNLVSAKSALQSAASVPGIAAYAQAQEGDAEYDVATEFTALISAIDAATTNLLSSIPTGTGGYVLMEQWSASGFVDRTFTTTQTATLRDLLQNIVDAIE